MPAGALALVPNGLSQPLQLCSLRLPAQHDFFEAGALKLLWLKREFSSCFVGRPFRGDINPNRNSGALAPEVRIAELFRPRRPECIAAFFSSLFYSRSSHRLPLPPRPSPSAPEI